MYYNKRKFVALFVVLYLFSGGCVAGLKNPDGTPATPLQKETTLAVDTGVMYKSARTQYFAFHDSPNITPEQKAWLEKNAGPALDKFQDAWVSWAKAVDKENSGQADPNTASLKANYTATMQTFFSLITQYIAEKEAKKKEKKDGK